MDEIKDRKSEDTKMKESLGKLADSIGAEAKREGVAKKVAKYNEKSGERISMAWASRDAYPVAAVE